MQAVLQQLFSRQMYDGTTMQRHCALYAYMPASAQANVDALGDNALTLTTG